MIKFFRHIRQDLLKNGKTSKYFKYALGEIVLVVIGILLALQINNWNEERKAKKQERSFISSIKKDLEADLVYLNEYLNKIEAESNELVQQRKRVSKPSFNKDSLVNYAKNEINPFLANFEGFNDNSYISLKSSGKIEIINEYLKKQLSDLAIQQEKIKEDYVSYRNDYTKEIQSLNALYPLPVSFSFIQSSYIDKLAWDNPNEKDLILRLNSWGTIKANFYRVNIRNFKNVLETTKTILKSLD